MSPKAIIQAAGAAVLALTLFGTSSAVASGSSEKPIRVQVFPGNVANLYAFLGKNKGFYEAAGLPVELVQIGSGPQASAALISKSVDMILNTPYNSLVIKARGFDPVAVVGVSEKPNFVLIARDASAYPRLSKGYPSLMDDVQGKRVGIYAPGSASEWFVKLLLSGADKPMSTVTFVNSGGPGQAIAGLMAGQLDIAADIYPVGLSMELAKTGKVILDCSVASCPASVVAPGAMGIAYVTSAEFVKKNEALVERFVQVHESMDAWIHDPANRDELRDQIAGFVTPPPGVDKDVYFERLAEWATHFFGVGLRPEAMEISMKGMLETGDLKSAVSTDGMVWERRSNNK